MWNGNGNAVMKMTMRYFSSSSRKRAPNLRKINPRVPFQEAASIAEDLYGVIKAHGPLTIGNAWNHAKDAGVSGLNSKTHLKIMLKWMRGRSMLKQICTHVGSNKKFLLTTFPEEPQVNEANDSPEPEPKAQRPLRFVGSDDVSITILYCGVCHADVVWTRNKMGHSNYPLVPGHEIVGIVTEVGGNADRFKVGEHVRVGTYMNSCRECECGGTITKGGYCTYIVVHQRYCYKIPENYPPQLAAPLLGITVYTPMVKHNMNQPGKSLGVVGLGGLSHLAVKFGKAFGLEVTVLSTSVSKRDEALKLVGADSFVVSSNEEEMKAMGGSFDFIINTASGDV
ncbi:cinnamyl-alcohol dehydrogenase [Perilla frutescens var. frutescens]|nr:cinnamyl-alcohol dehydrogenase [Perilla frutescens var. frutescens]